MEERVISVKGKGKASIPPDTIEINMILTTLKPTYEEAMNAASRDLDELRLCLRSAGFDKKEIKTTNFRVDTKYENISDANGNYRRVFVGYEVTNNLRIEFEQNAMMLTRVLNALAGCKSTPEFSIRYKVKDDTEVKDLLLERAVEDARSKAKVMAEAAGVRLGKVLSIDYSGSDIQLYRDIYSINKNLISTGGAPNIDLQPDDIDVEDTVTVVWRMES
ncbi:SIMPL domain-containing protein [Clostridium sp. UBA5712]|uniref:SIMPL domain-containing protein n=1 Tax=Clostridium sp. UBA5712 TaxID=1946368 RepID=UPI003216F908